MVAIMGADEAAVNAICDEARQGGVLVPANYNAPGQIVISGSLDACNRGLKAAEAKGLKAVALKVAGAFHSPIMQSGADKMKAELEKWARVKPLLWFWQMFDHSPVGRNVRLGTQMRYMLAKRIFKKCGDKVRIFHEVEFSFGYNLSVGDGVTIHRNVLIDDRGEVVIGDEASISDYVNIYSHAHAVEDIHDIKLHKTEIGPRARITYHSVVLSGVKVGPDAIVGSMGVASKPVEPGWIVGGIPAKQIAQKSVK